MGQPARPEEIRRIPYFASLNDDEAEEFATELLVREYGPRQLILREGSDSSGFFYLRSGKARIFRAGVDGREQTLRLVTPGDTCGEVPVLDHAPAPSSVEAIEPCEVIVIPASAFLGLIERHPAVGLAMLRHFARRLRSFTDLIEQISLQTVQSRVARYLYQAARETGMESPDGIVIPRALTQQDIASLVGSVREVVSRTLRTMEEDGVIEVRRKDIVVRDLRRLEKLL